MALSPLKASSETYTIGVVPQFEARELADIWGHVATTLNQNTPYDFAFVGSANIPDFEKKFLNGDFDFIYSNPYHALTAYVTGSDVLSILIASHIIPWSEASDDERLDVDNGILLSPLYDALFDKHLISFDNEGNILFSEILTDDHIGDLGISTNAKISVKDGMLEYLARHREKLVNN